jgi:predicted GNAT family acetyltransferase
MEHVLDNPVYNAMISGNRHLSAGTESVRYFPIEISPFVGLKEYDAHSFGLLADMLPPKRIAVTNTTMDIIIPDSWKIVHLTMCLQMIREVPMKPPEIQHEIVPLHAADVPLMLELNRLTNPGPFEERTIEFGNYAGIFNGRQLIAMAGHRMHANQYVEVSAVCTHPDHTGNGYGRALMLYQAEQIVQAGNIPMLHVRTDNVNAINLYKKSGFLTRCETFLYVIQKLS